LFDYIKFNYFEFVSALRFHVLFPLRLAKTKNIASLNQWFHNHTVMRNFYQQARCGKMALLSRIRKNRRQASAILIMSFLRPPIRQL
jgi:hypothetical protein